MHHYLNKSSVMVHVIIIPIKILKTVKRALNSIPHNIILDLSKLKAFADDKTNMAEKLKFILEGVENIVGKGENAGYHHFHLFQQCFQKASFSTSIFSFKNNVFKRLLSQGHHGFP